MAFLGSVKPANDSSSNRLRKPALAAKQCAFNAIIFRPRFQTHVANEALNERLTLPRSEARP